MLRLENVNFFKDNKDILKDINLEIPEDKFVAVTGPNGSGKSTLAKIIMGIEKPTSGKIYFNDKEVFDTSKLKIRGVHNHENICTCMSLLYDMVDYVNTVSTEEINIDLNKILSKSRMLRTSAGVRSDGTARLQGEHWISDVKWITKSDGSKSSKITSYCTIENVNCVGVCVPCTVADPTYNMQFADGRWQTNSTPPNSVYGYSTQKMACILRSNADGSIMYLPCSHIDAKGHTFIGGLAQTNVKLLSSNKDESGKVISFNVQVSRDWSGTKAEHQLNETWTLAQVGYKMNSKLIDHVSNPVSPASMVDNIAEFWHVNDQAWDAIKNNYQVLGFVVWPNGT